MLRHISWIPPIYATSPTPTPSGSVANSTAMAIPMPANMTIICSTSVQMTAVMPPMIV